MPKKQQQQRRTVFKTCEVNFTCIFRLLTILRGHILSLSTIVNSQDMSQSFAPMPTRTSHANSINSPPTTNPAPNAHHTTPAFLSLFPRSLSSLSLGTRKKDKELETGNVSHNSSKMSLGSALSPPGPGSGGKKSSGNSGSNRHSQSMHSPDIPPPLPQRNPPRKSLDINSNPFEIFRNTPISDLDHSGSGIITSHNNSNSSGESNKQGKATGQKNSPTMMNQSNSNNNDNGSGKKSKRSKNKTKALSDPKMSSQMFIQMEQQQVSPHHHPQPHHGDISGKPPPLPPRQYLMDENRLNNNISPNNNNSGRALPNSIETIFNYPLVTQCTPVRDNLSPFPFTHRPNIVQKLQESQAASNRGGGQDGKRGSAQQGQKSHHDNPVLSTSTHISANKSTVSKLI